jgi:hypothetical protein
MIIVSMSPVGTEVASGSAATEELRAVPRGGGVEFVERVRVCVTGWKSHAPVL